MNEPNLYDWQIAILDYYKKNGHLIFTKGRN
jgi:hypothetical protein